MTHIRELLAAGPTLSFEFFPPKTDEAGAALRATVAELAAVNPAFVSVTCGAGGLAQDNTRDVVVDIVAQHPFPAMAHLTCVGFGRDDVASLLDDYERNGVRNVLALAGDPPLDGSTPRGDFRYASELVAMIRERGGFSVGVAAHPEVHPRSADRDSDRRHLAAKLETADFAVTQFFFRSEDYFRLVEELGALKVDKPIVPGVFPVTAPKIVKRFAAMNGAWTPDDLFAKVEASEVTDRQRIAIDHAVELSQRLLDGGAPGVHLYTMNRAEAALAIVAELGLAPQR